MLTSRRQMGLVQRNARRVSPNLYPRRIFWHPERGISRESGRRHTAGKSVNAPQVQNRPPWAAVSSCNRVACAKSGHSGKAPAIGRGFTRLSALTGGAPQGGTITQLLRKGLNFRWNSTKPPRGAFSYKDYEWRVNFGEPMSFWLHFQGEGKAVHRPGMAKPLHLQICAKCRGIRCFWCQIVRNQSFLWSKCMKIAPHCIFPLRVEVPGCFRM